MSLALPPGYPELLGTLAASVEEELRALLPDLEDRPCGELALQLAEDCRNSIGGLRVPAVPRVAAIELEMSDRTYAMVSVVWLARLVLVRPDMPEGWLKVAVARLLDCLRKSVGGFTVPRGRALLKLRNAKMFEAFRGDFQEVAATFGMCAERARQIITEKMKAERAARQKVLFDPPAD